MDLFRFAYVKTTNYSCTNIFVLKIKIFRNRDAICTVMNKAFSRDTSFSNEDLTKPEEPNEEDCCRSGCQNCVFDVYTQALDKWKRSKELVNSSLRHDLLSLTKFKPFVLTSIKKISDNTNLYSFKPHVKDRDSLSGFLPYNPGQYLALRLDKSKFPLSSSNPNEGSNTDSNHLIRDFTITSLPNKSFDCSFEMIIKLYEGSFTSSYINSINIGELTYWRGPYGDFKHVPNKFNHLIMFCMGTGVAPMIPIANEIVDNENDETMVSLHFGVRRNSEIIFREEIGKLSLFWNFNCSYYLSHEKDTSNKKYNEKFILNSINENSVKEAIGLKTNVFVLVCGSPEFNDFIKEILDTLNIDNSRYYLF